MYKIARWAVATAFGLFIALNAPVSATASTIIWDYSPETTGASGNTSYVNRAGSQNFAELIAFESSVQITGMDIYSHNLVSVGQSATVRLWSDVAGQPGSLIASFSDTISIVDGDGALQSTTRKHVSFALPLMLAAETSYWIGMSGTTSELGLLGLSTNAPGDSRMFQFSGLDPRFFTSTGVGDTAFRLHGEISPIPVPAALPLFGTGIALMGLMGWWRRRKVVIA